MGFFADRKEDKTRLILEQYGLENLSDPKDIESVKRVASRLSGNGIFELSGTVGGDVKDMQRLQVYYQQAIIEQNFIIIRQLDRISTTLKGMESE